MSLKRAVARLFYFFFIFEGMARFRQNIFRSSWMDKNMFLGDKT